MNILCEIQKQWKYGDSNQLVHVPFCARVRYVSILCSDQKTIGQMLVEVLRSYRGFSPQSGMIARSVIFLRHLAYDIAEDQAFEQRSPAEPVFS